MRSGSGMIGVGMCPEGIEQNPIVYDLMSEWAFRCACALMDLPLQRFMLINPDCQSTITIGNIRKTKVVCCECH